MTMTMTREEKEAKRLAITRDLQKRQQKIDHEWAYSVFKTWKEGDPDNIFKSASTEDNLKELFGGDENEEREIARILESWMSESFASLIPSEAEKQLETEWQKAEYEAQKKADESLARCREIDPYEPVLPPEEDTPEMDKSWYLCNSGDIAYVIMANIEELQKDGNQEMLNSDFYKHYVKVVGEVLDYYERYLMYEGISRKRSVKNWLAYDPHYCESEGYARDEALYAGRHTRLQTFRDRYSLIIAEEKKNGRI